MDLQRRAHLTRMAITNSGGERVIRKPGPRDQRPTRDRLSPMPILLQTGRLTMATALPEAVTRVQERLGCQVITPPHGHEMDLVWREGCHDALIPSEATQRGYARTLNKAY